MEDQGYVEQGQAAVHEDHLVDEGGAELVADFAEEGDVDESKEGGAYHGGYLEVKPLSSGLLGHFKQTTANERPPPTFILRTSGRERTPIETDQDATQLTLLSSFAPFKLN